MKRQKRVRFEAEDEMKWMLRMMEISWRSESVSEKMEHVGIWVRNVVFGLKKLVPGENTCTLLGPARTCRVCARETAQGRRRRRSRYSPRRGREVENKEDERGAEGGKGSQKTREEEEQSGMVGGKGKVEEGLQGAKEGIGDGEANVGGLVSEGACNAAAYALEGEVVGEAVGEALLTMQGVDGCKVLLDGGGEEWTTGKVGRPATEGKFGGRKGVPVGIDEPMGVKGENEGKCLKTRSKVMRGKGTALYGIKPDEDLQTYCATAKAHWQAYCQSRDAGVIPTLLAEKLRPGEEDLGMAIDIVTKFIYENVNYASYEMTHQPSSRGGNGEPVGDQVYEALQRILQEERLKASRDTAPILNVLAKGGPAVEGASEEEIQRRIDAAVANAVACMQSGSGAGRGQQCRECGDMFSTAREGHKSCDPCNTRYRTTMGPYSASFAPQVRERAERDLEGDIWIEGAASKSRVTRVRLFGLSWDRKWGILKKVEGIEGYIGVPEGFFFGDLVRNVVHTVTMLECFLPGRNSQN
ncbi:hypothetical protein BC829DRAFT_414200 [Chytridium lagenaria]|nr:hypothetical protein BC829DRAFT_414200 [Chytridium lagenaria]